MRGDGLFMRGERELTNCNYLTASKQLRWAGEVVINRG